jgi:hypothetical protein
LFKAINGTGTTMHFADILLDNPAACNVEIVIPLDQPIEFELVEPRADCVRPDEWYPVNTLIVKTQGLIVAAMDSPNNPEEFIKLAKQQCAQAVNSKPSAQIQPLIVELHDAALRLLSEWKLPVDTRHHEAMQYKIKKATVTQLLKATESVKS